MLNSIQHNISNANKYKNIKKIKHFQGQISLECYFFMLKKVEMPIIGISTFMSRKISRSAEHEKTYNLGASSERLKGWGI